MYVHLSAPSCQPSLLTRFYHPRLSGHQTAQGPRGRPESRNGIRRIFFWGDSFYRLVDPCPQHCTRPKGALHGRHTRR